MSALTLTLRDSLAQSVDMSPLTPDRLHGKSLTEIAAVELISGNRRLRVDALFEVAGSDAANMKIVNGANTKIGNGSGKLRYLGRGMTAGCISVEGDAGAYLGMEMRAGRIDVSGNSGAWTASGMVNGAIHVRGNVGDFLGAAIPGDKQGMQGGMVIVGGNAGDRAGDHLRRGMLLINGDAGAYCASRMLAGTIVVKGRAGPGAGFGMKRGTLVVAQLPQLPPTFNDCGVHSLPFLNLLHRYFRAAGAEAAAFYHDGIRVRRYMGDLANGGSGEVLQYV